MLYEPSYTQPYLISIDARKSNNFSCIINASSNTFINAYRIRINDLNAAGIYDTNKIALSTKLYNGQQLVVPIPATTAMVNGVDYVWNIELYEVNPDIFIVSARTNANSSSNSIRLKPNNNIEVGMFLKIGNEIREITSYTNSTGIAIVRTPFSVAPVTNTLYTVYSNFIKSSDIFFKARADATLSINSFPNPITNRQYTFNGTYTQTENTSWKYFRWQMYDDKNILIGDSGQVESGTIQYTFNGFLDNTSYKIQLSVETQDGIYISTPIQDILVDYEEPEITLIPSCKVLCDKTAVETNWSQPILNLGTTGGTGAIPRYDIIPNIPFLGTNSVRIYRDNYISWETATSVGKVDIPYTSTTFTHCKIDGGFRGDIINLNTLPVVLVGIFSTAPATANVGDIYYNSSENLLYKCLIINSWNTSYLPIDTNMYKVGNITYIYNGTTLVVTTEILPYYRVWYDNGKMYYDIQNIDIKYTGSLDIPELPEVWFLQPQDTVKNRPFTWDDNATWDDSMYWTEQITGFLETHWIKLTLLPDIIQLSFYQINQLNAFREPNKPSIYSSVLYGDYKLKDTDVLYD